MKAYWKKHTLIFKNPSGTSRGILKKKSSWFLILEDDGNTRKKAIGECGLLQGLSVDDFSQYENVLNETCQRINAGNWDLEHELVHFPSIRFGLEILKKDWQAKNKFELFPSDFTKNESPIKINGLIWMGEKEFMFKQIKQKIKDGFDCIKLKIGAIDFDDEINLLKYIRKEFSEEEIELRVDANGAFAPNEALEKLSRLSELNLHSIEQPIKQGQEEAMANLCEKTPLPIALDEELIGIFQKEEKQKLLEQIKPQYIILKPSLIGGFQSSEEWINIAEKNKIAWWLTSALESNIGLNAISQWAYTLGNPMPQGLGTGQLYTNNFESPLEVQGGKIHYRQNRKWDFGKFF